MHAYGGVNQQLSQVSDAIVLGFDVYFGARRAAASGKASFREYVRRAVLNGKSQAGGTSRSPLKSWLETRHKPHEVYENPAPTMRACGHLLSTSLDEDGGSSAT